MKKRRKRDKIVEMLQMKRQRNIFKKLVVGEDKTLIMARYFAHCGVDTLFFAMLLPIGMYQALKLFLFHNVLLFSSILDQRGPAVYNDEWKFSFIIVHV